MWDVCLKMIFEHMPTKIETGRMDCIKTQKSLTRSGNNKKVEKKTTERKTIFTDRTPDKKIIHKT